MALKFNYNYFFLVLFLLILSFHGKNLASDILTANASGETSELSSDLSPFFINEKNLGSRVPESVILSGSGKYFSPFVFLVDKTSRALSIWKAKANRSLERVGYYPTDIGKKVGNKQAWGDHRTPEGIYFFQERFDGNHLEYEKYGSGAFSLDYPNFFDRQIGKTGSGIWLHAVPDSIPLTRGSRGCVVVRDQIIKTLNQYIALSKTPILIYDRIRYVSPDQRAGLQEKFTDYLSRWRQAWEAKNMSAYLDFYSDQFRALKMNKKQWEVFKTSLKDRYGNIQIRLSEPAIYQHNDEVIVRVLQHYASDGHSDFGEKTLYLRQEGERFRILTEQWQDRSKDHVALDTFPTAATAAQNTLLRAPAQQQPHQQIPHQDKPSPDISMSVKNP